MGERILRRPNRVNIRRPLPPPPSSESPPLAYSSKKPTLAITGTKTDRICAICLGKLEPGNKLTFCQCGKFFHLYCISELDECPLCNFSISIKEELPCSNFNNGNVTENEQQENDILELVYQCPVCESYVSENTEKCKCGVIFEMENEDVYLCPGCGHEVDPDAKKCENCDMIYED